MKNISTGLLQGNMDSGSKTQGARSGSSVRSDAGSAYGGLEGGKLVEGEIIDLIGKNVKLQMMNGQQIFARLENAPGLSIGQRAQFLVADSDPQHITLKVIPQENTISDNPAVERALTAAGLPFTPRNRAAVAALLENKQSIDKASIHKLLATSVANKSASFETLAQMQRFKMPINQLTSSQYEAYRNLEHRLNDQLQSLGEQLSEYAQGTEGTSDLISKNLEILKLLTSQVGGDTQNGADMQSDANAAQQAAGADVLQNGANAGAELSGVQNGEAQAAQPGMLQNDMQGEAVLQTETGISQAQGEMNAQSVAESGKQTDINAQAAQSAGRGEGTTETESIQNKAESLGRLINQLAGAEDDISKQSQQVLRAGADEGALREFLLSPQYKKFLARSFMKGMQIKPEDVSREGLRELYERMEERLDSLKRLVAHEDSSGGKALAASAENTRGSIDFMHTLNDIFTYVQLPLQLKEGSANGELYVYTKKNKPLSEDGSIRVLLHLNLKSLGALDVHLTLKEKMLTAMFYSEDEESVKLLAQNLPQLDSQLQKGGYIVSSQVASRAPAKEQIKEFLLPEEAMELKRYTFDIRA